MLAMRTQRGFTIRPFAGPLVLALLAVLLVASIGAGSAVAQDDTLARPAADGLQDPDPGEKPPIDCEAKCAEHAEAVRAKCLAAGGDEADCAAKTAATLEWCMDKCAGAGEPGDKDKKGAWPGKKKLVKPGKPGAKGAKPPLDCPTRCDKIADQALGKCLAAGGDEAACAGRSKALREQCMDKCERSGKPGDKPGKPGDKPGKPLPLAPSADA
jgi:hypothetical protein